MYTYCTDSGWYTGLLIIGVAFIGLLITYTHLESNMLYNAETENRLDVFWQPVGDDKYSHTGGFIESYKLILPLRSECPYYTNELERKEKDKRKERDRRKERDKRKTRSKIKDNSEIFTLNMNLSLNKKTYLDPPGPVTALASFPGSGNTWTRHLLEELSGN